MKPAIGLVVTDLDNTLYDWVAFFTTSFYKMVKVAADKLGVSQDHLLDQLRDVHRRYNNSEHPFALLETAVVRERYPELSRSELACELDDIFHEFNRARKQTLRLYRGVRETLQELLLSGTTIVGHTEATVPNALFRLRSLDIERFFHKLYAVTPSGGGHHDKERSERLLQTTVDIRYLKSEERKPHPGVLLEICRTTGSSPKQTLYIGDSLSRDIKMAMEAGVWSAWAKYGTLVDPNVWSRLARVTHWSEEDIRREREVRGSAEQSVMPDHILHSSIEEIFQAFQFISL